MAKYRARNKIKKWNHENMKDVHLPGKIAPAKRCKDCDQTVVQCSNTGCDDRRERDWRFLGYAD